MRKVNGWSLIGLVCLVTAASAQVREQPRPAVRPGAAPAPAATGAAQQGSADQQIAACLWGGNRNEIELAKLAQQKAKSGDVKDFAAHMIKDHTKQLDTLAKEAGNLVSAETARGGTTEETRREVRKVPADEQPRRDEPRREERRDERRGEAGQEGRREEGREERTTTTTTQGQHGFNWVAIHREMADQCLQSTKKEMSGKEGSEFDQCYMGLQVAAHMKMLDELKVFKNHATGRLQQDIEDAISTTEHHLKEAKGIYDDLAGANTSKSEKKSDRSNDKRDRDDK